MGNGWVLSPSSGVSCDFVCAHEGTNGVPNTDRMDRVRRPNVINDLYRSLTGENCFDVVIDDPQPYYPGVTVSGPIVSCKTQPGESDPASWEANVFPICCCITDQNRHMTPEQACPLSDDCAVFGLRQEDCPARCAWRGGWRAERAKRVAALKKKLRAARGDRRRRRVLRRRLGHTYRVYAGCAKKSGCQEKDACKDLCRPVCSGSARGDCVWREDGLGCVKRPTLAPTPGPTPVE